MLKKVKKGFSLIELLVVIAIIGILSAVGITAYSGYTADAKEQATRAMHAQMVALTNAEMAKCSQGSGTWAWGGACTVTITAAALVTYGNDTLGMKNPHSVDTNGLISAATNTLGAVNVTSAAGVVTFNTLVEGSTVITAVVNPY
jgi:prepilin-type N-terminal cleavage/methylation domain-containing protein